MKRTDAAEKQSGQEFFVRTMASADFDDLLGRLERHEGLRDGDFPNLIDILRFSRYLQIDCNWTDEEVARLRAVILDRGKKSKPESKAPDDEKKPAPAPDQGDKPSDPKPPTKQSRPGRRGALDRKTKQVHKHSIDGLKVGDGCPCCGLGKMLGQDPLTILRIVGRSPFELHRHEADGLRCSLCQAVLRPELPASIERDAIGNVDVTAVAALMVWRYEFGQPFYRMDLMTTLWGDRIHDSTMWEVVEEGAGWLFPLFRYYLSLGANSPLLRFDDVSARVIELKQEIRAEQELARQMGADPDAVRSGIHTSCFVATTADGHSFVLYFTGRHHCGEKFETLVSRREAESPLKTVSDMASTNRNLAVPGVVIIQGGCWEHVRQKFDKLKNDFPAECRKVLGAIKLLFANDEQAKRSGLSATDQMAYHQAESKPLVDGLYDWVQAQKDGRQYEPNGNLGGAMAYLLNHRKNLTEFLRTPGIPLHNNDAERAGKRVKRHENNSLSYRSATGAIVGDIIMTLASAANLADENFYEYLLFALRHREEVRENPERFVAWRWRATQAELEPPETDKSTTDWREIVVTHHHVGKPVEATRDITM